MSSTMVESPRGALEMTLAAVPESIPVARRAVAAMLDNQEVGPELAGDVSTALSEAAMNSVTHAYPEGGGEFQVRAKLEGGRLDVEVRDWGCGIRPRIEAATPGLRIGLSLISAVSDEFELRSGRNGTQVKMRFDLEREREPEAPPREPPARDRREAVIRLRSENGVVGPSVSSTLAMLAAQVDMPVDRVSEVQVIGDLLASAISRGPENSLEIRIRQLEQGIELRIGPFERGGAERMLERAALSEVGNAFERLASELRIEDAGGSEQLLIAISAQAARD